jgi:hypothetical protein
MILTAIGRKGSVLLKRAPKNRQKKIMREIGG